MRALVTGGTGFLGRHLCQLLVQSRWSVAAIVRSGGEPARADQLRGLGCEILTTAETTDDIVAIVKQGQADVVFHLATQFVGEHGSGDIEALVESNVLFGTRVLEGVRQAGRGALVCVGTRWQHFGDAAYSPVSLYAATKQAFEDIVQYYAEVQGVPALALHLTDCYGSSDERRKLLDRLLDAQRTDTPLKMSPGHQAIDLLHVTDAARALVVAGARVIGDGRTPGVEQYVARSGRSVTIRELVALFEQVRNCRLSVEWGVRPYRARETFGPWTSGTVLPGWTPTVALEDGLRSLA